MKNILLAVIAIGLLVMFVLALNTGLRRSEIAECMTWKQHAAEIAGFWLTAAERAQCDAVGVDVSEIRVNTHAEE